MSSPVRVRFAPSPTGPLHIGGVRTALFNYLFAKKNGGTFVLRIEDTDQNRYVEGAESYIVEALNWCGIPFDEGPGKDGGFGPYRQSERKAHYEKYAQELIEKDFAYYAFDTPEHLDLHRKDHEAKGKTFIYNWHNRLKLDNSLSLDEESTKAKLASGAPYVVRFKTPQDQQLVLKDIVRGTIEIDTNILDDKILFKSDGMPTYHLANIVDDHLMQISHVIRGEEWLPSLALHCLLYDAFDWERPKFAHLPLIMKPTGKGKLSKRDGEKGGFPIFPLAWNTSEGYKDEGYFPEAVINFLALLGWNPGTEQELFSLGDLVKTFGLERVNKSGARFDPEKNRWFNQQWLQRKSDSELAGMLLPLLNANDVPESLKTKERLLSIVPLLKERASFVSDFWELGQFFFVDPKDYNEKAVKKQWKPDTAELMENISSLIAKVEPFMAESLQVPIKNYINQNELSFGKIMAPLRLAMVGDVKGPDLFATMALIGKEACLARIARAISVLG